jgi:hypothetical protein
MARKKKLFQGLDPWRPAAVVQEVVSHLLLVGFALGFGIGYLGLMLVFMAEIVIGNLITAALYPERGVGRHVLDLVKFLALMAFLLVFVVATYLAAKGGGSSGVEMWAQLRVDGEAALAAVGLAAVHLSVLFFVARRTTDPKLAWARMVLMQNAATLIGLFIMIFVAVFAGPVLGVVAKMMGLTRPVDAALIVCMAGIRLALALLLTRMPEREARDIAGQPYLD